MAKLAKNGGVGAEIINTWFQRLSSTMPQPCSDRTAEISPQLRVRSAWTIKGYFIL